MIFLYFASESFKSRAKVLTDSIKKFHPDDKIVHVDPGESKIGSYVPNMAKQRLEKALELLETTKEDVIIIGADCKLFGQINYGKFGDVYIVPHVKKPLDNRKYMVQIYETGHANADFIILTNCENSKNIVKWLISVTEDGKKPGEFYEQTWLSSLPFLFQNVVIIQDPGYNVGYWDINHCNLHWKNDRWYVDKNSPLILYQFSGFEKGKPFKMSRHSQEECKNSMIYNFYKDYDDRIEI